jgi:hypothetical protein
MASIVSGSDNLRLRNMTTISSPLQKHQKINKIDINGNFAKLIWSFGGRGE